MSTGTNRFSAGLLRQLRQEQADARVQFNAAKVRSDQRAQAFIAGQLSAFQMMIETIELTASEPPSPAMSRRRSA